MKQLKFINGIKGISCIGILLGHYAGIYKYAENITPFPLLDNLLIYYPFNLFLNEGLWLCVFCILSGYLCNYSQIQKYTTLLKKTAKRFLRLFFPILGGCIFVFFIQLTFGFHTQATKIIFLNTWFQQSYQSKFTLLEVLASPFITLLKGDSNFIAPYWMLSKLFFSSLIIYLGNLLVYRFPKIKLIINSLELVLCIKLFSYIGFGCIMGALVCQYSPFLIQKLNQLKNKSCLFGITIILLCIHNYISPFIQFNLLKYNSFWETFYMTLLFLTVLMNERIQGFFCFQLFQLTNKISFGIYSLHWPIFCSMSSFLFVKYGLTEKTYFIIGFFSILIIIIASCIYHVLFEKHAMHFINKIFN